MKNAYKNLMILLEKLTGRRSQAYVSVPLRSPSSTLKRAKFGETLQKPTTPFLRRLAGIMALACSIALVCSLFLYRTLPAMAFSSRHSSSEGSGPPSSLASGSLVALTVSPGDGGPMDLKEGGANASTAATSRSKSGTKGRIGSFMLAAVF